MPMHQFAANLGSFLWSTAVCALNNSCESIYVNHFAHAALTQGFSTLCQGEGAEWTRCGAQVLGHNGFVARHDWEGVYAVASSRAPRDVRGQTLAVRFEIIDKRPRGGPGGARNASRGPYSVAVRLQVGIA